MVLPAVSPHLDLFFGFYLRTSWLAFPCSESCWPRCDALILACALYLVLAKSRGNQCCFKSTDVLNALHTCGKEG